MSAEEGKLGQLHEAGGPAAPATATKTLLIFLAGYAQKEQVNVPPGFLVQCA